MKLLKLFLISLHHVLANTAIFRENTKMSMGDILGVFHEGGFLGRKHAKRSQTVGVIYNFCIICRLHCQFRQNAMFQFG